MSSNNSLRTLQVVGANRAGGAETFYLRFIKSLREHCEVTPVVKRRSWLAEQLQNAKISHLTLPFGGMFDFKSESLFREYIREKEPHVVQTWMNRASRFIPEKTDQAAVVGRLGGYYDLKYYKRCEWLVGNTQSICDYLVKAGKPADKVRYIPNFPALPLDGYEEERWDVRESYNIPQEAFVVLMAGRLHENKGFDLALYALNKLPKNVYMLVAGEGSQYRDLQAMVDADGLSHRVRFAGWLSRVSPLAAAADMWLVPSRHEPLGNVILDAWMHKVPVAATNVSGPAALVENEETGLLLPPEDETAIVEAVLRLQNDQKLRNKLVQNGYDHMQTHFAPDKVVKQWVDFYQEIRKF